MSLPSAAFRTPSDLIAARQSVTLSSRLASFYYSLKVHCHTEGQEVMLGGEEKNTPACVYYGWDNMIFDSIWFKLESRRYMEECGKFYGCRSWKEEDHKSSPVQFIQVFKLNKHKSEELGLFFSNNVFPLLLYFQYNFIYLCLGNHIEQLSTYNARCTLWTGINHKTTNIQRLWALNYMWSCCNNYKVWINI